MLLAFFAILILSLPITGRLQYFLDTGVRQAACCSARQRVHTLMSVPCCTALKIKSPEGNAGLRRALRWPRKRHCCSVGCSPLALRATACRANEYAHNVWSSHFKAVHGLASIQDAQGSLHAYLEGVLRHQGWHQSVPFSVAFVCRERKVGVLYRISVFFLAFTMLGWFRVTSCAAQRAS